MENIIVFFSTYGLVLTIIAVIGIIILGFLKYCHVFEKLDEQTRHVLYLGISIGISLIASAIYVIVVNGFEWNYFVALALAIYALNQTFYNFFKVTKLNDLFVKILDFIKSLIKHS